MIGWIVSFCISMGIIIAICAITYVIVNHDK